MNHHVGAKHSGDKIPNSTKIFYPNGDSYIAELHPGCDLRFAAALRYRITYKIDAPGLDMTW